jgi:hypothetical protein
LDLSLLKGPNIDPYLLLLPVLNELWF